MKFKKTLITTVLGSTMLAGSITGFVSCSQQVKSNLANEISTSPSNDDDSYNIGIDKKIADNINLNKPEYKSIDSNEYKLLMNFNDFSNNFTFDKTQFSEEGLKIDIANYVYNMWISSGKKLEVQLLKDFTYKYDAENNTISFEIDLVVTNKTNNVKYFSFSGKDYYVPEHHSSNLNIKVENQKVNFYFIESNSTNKELAWKVDNVSINFLNQKSVGNNFSLVVPSIGLYSLPYTVNGVTTKNNYLEAEKDWNKYHFSQAEYKTYLENYLKTTATMSIELIGSSGNLLKSIAANPSLKEFLSGEGGKELINLLVNANVIDKDIAPFLKDLINPDTPLTNAIHNNVDSIAKFVVNNFDSDLVSEDLLKDVLSIISPNMIESQKQQINSFLELIPENLSFVKNIVDLVFKNKTSWDILEYVINNNSQHIVDNIGGMVNNKELVDDVVNLLKILLTKKDDGQYKGILDVLSEEKVIIKSLINTAFNLFGMGNSFAGLFDELYTNNDKITVQNIKNTLDQSVIPLAEFLSNSLNYKVETGYNQDLTFDGNKISYKYHIKFVFSTNFKFNLTPIYALLPNTINYNIIPIPVSLVLTYLPEWIQFGINDSINLYFSAQNTEVYKTPTKNANGTYTMGFTIPQTVKFEMNLPKAVQSIIGQYTYQIFWVNTLPWDFITSLLKTLVLKDYEFFDTIKISNSKYVITNYEDEQYISDYHVSWKNILAQDVNKLFNYVDAGTEKGKSYSVKSKPTAWKFDGKITGDQPSIAQKDHQTILDSVLTFSNSINNLPENLKPVVSIVPVMNGTIKAFGAISSAELTLRTIKVSVYFPFKILDITNWNQESKTGELKFTNLFTKELQFTN